MTFLSWPTSTTVKDEASVAMIQLARLTTKGSNEHTVIIVS